MFLLEALRLQLEEDRKVLRAFLVDRHAGLSRMAILHSLDLSRNIKQVQVSLSVREPYYIDSGYGSKGERSFSPGYTAPWSPGRGPKKYRSANVGFQIGGYRASRQDNMTAYWCNKPGLPDYSRELEPIVPEPIQSGSCGSVPGTCWTT
jgi:hypothetical protein